MTALYISLGVGGGIVAIIAIIWLILHRKEQLLDEADAWLVREFRRCNVMVWGKKGSGKDVIFAHVIALRGEKHYSNIPYDENTEVIELCELSAGGNTFEDCINGTITKFEPRFEEGCDIYGTDIGIYFPNTSDTLLNKQYASTPVFMAIIRHLYNSNFHMNCQAFDRPWKKMREQADSYIHVLGTVRRGDFLYTKIVCYDSYSNAEKEVNPVAKYKVRTPIAELQYDSRYFRNVFFENPPTDFETVMSYIIWR